MTSILDVAKYILTKMGTISTWKLQKLCFYSQAWSLAWTETPIFAEDFQAWANGPVCPELFHAHQHLFYIDPESFIFGDVSKITQDQKETIDIVLKDYGSMEPYQLRELTHNEDPWKNARNGLPDGAICNAVITKESIGSYYGSL